MRISDWSSDVCSSDLHEITGVCVQLDGPAGEFERKLRGMTFSLGVVVTDIWDVPDIRGPSTLGVAREFLRMGPLVGSLGRLLLRCSGWSWMADGSLSFGDAQSGLIASGNHIFWSDTMRHTQSDTALYI